MKVHQPDNIPSLRFHFEEKRTLISLFERSFEKFQGNPVFWEKTGSEYQSTTYRELQKRIHQMAAGILSLGIQPGDKVALLSQARKDWVVAEMGILYAGATNVPLSVKLDSADLLFRLKHAEVKMLIMSEYQYAGIKDQFKNLPDLKQVVFIDSRDLLEKGEMNLNELLKSGELYLESNPGQLQNIANEVQEDDCALISYTSGTTADPKGIMLSHNNLYTNCEQSLQMFKVEESFRTLLILPLDHSFAHTTGMYVFIASGASLASVQLGRTPTATLKNVSSNMNEIKPDVLLSVPALAKKLKVNVENGIRKKGPVVRWLFRKGIQWADNYFGLGWDRGKGTRIFFKPLYKLIDLLVFKKIRENFGGRLLYFVGGGALLDIELQKFFFAIGIPMFQGYGLSEAAPVISSNTISMHKMGSSGRIVPGLEIKICDETGEEVDQGREGEIIVRGGNVMSGYYRNESATRETLRKGWLYTGDLGYLDNDGFLYVKGRFKSLLIGDDGEKYSPESIEEFLEEHCKLISQAMLYNNQKPYTTALIFPDSEALKGILNKSGLSDKDPKVEEYLIEQINLEIKAVTSHNQNMIFPKRWLPSTFYLLQEGFTEQNQLMNSTMKMVRGKITERYADEIQYLYTPTGKPLNNPMNIQSLKNLLKR